MSCVKMMKDGLTIVLHDDMMSKVREHAQEIANDIDSGKCITYNVTGDEYIAAIERLCNIVNNIFGYVPKYDIFQYLPLTTKGKFPRNQSILIADTDVKNTLTDGYFTRKTLQLRLMPCYESGEDWKLGKEVPDTMALCIDEFNSTSRTSPIFNKDNIPSKVSKVRTKYLKNSEILPGHVYKDINNNKYLYLGYFHTSFGIKTRSTLLSGSGLISKSCNEYARHAYVRMSKKISYIAEMCMTIDDFLDKLVVECTDDNHIFLDILLRYENPRKFVEECDMLIYDDTITNHIVESKSVIDDYYGKCQFVVRFEPAK